MAEKNFLLTEENKRLLVANARLEGCVEELRRHNLDLHEQNRLLAEEINRKLDLLSQRGSTSDAIDRAVARFASTNVGRITGTMARRSINWVLPTEIAEEEPDGVADDFTREMADLGL